MTTQEKLHIVETAIRKVLPRLTEPTEGCWVIFRNIKNKKQSGKILYLYEQDFYRIFCKNESDEYFRRRNEVEIVGHDILLPYVLEWLGTSNFSVRFSEDGRFNLYRRVEGLVGYENYNYVQWDLSKPYLKDQNEKLIEFLYNLIQK